jgi:hypothetical protein
MISISRPMSREGVMMAFRVEAESYQTPWRAAMAQHGC